MYSGNISQISFQTNRSVQNGHFCHLLNCFILLVVLIWFIALLLLLPSFFLFKYKFNKIGIKSSLKSKHVILLFWARCETYIFDSRKIEDKGFSFDKSHVLNVFQISLGEEKYWSMTEAKQKIIGVKKQRDREVLE